MKTDAELDDLSQKLYWHKEHGETRHAIKLLRSIQIDALRQAVEIVEKHGDDDLGHAGCIDDMEKLIRQLELRWQPH